MGDGKITQTCKQYKNEIRFLIWSSVPCSLTALTESVVATPTAAVSVLPCLFPQATTPVAADHDAPSASLLTQLIVRGLHKAEKYKVFGAKPKNPHIGRINLNTLVYYSPQRRYCSYWADWQAHSSAKGANHPFRRGKASFHCKPHLDGQNVVSFFSCALPIVLTQEGTDMLVPGLDKTFSQQTFSRQLCSVSKQSQC